MLCFLNPFQSTPTAAFVQFTAEPLAGLVDTAYLGRLGPIGKPLPLPSINPLSP
jgi:hypothetical protein